MESIWKNRKFSLFGPFWDPQIAFGFGAGLTGSKGTTFGKANFETQFCKIGLGLSPFRKIFLQKDRSAKIMAVGKKFPKCAGFRPCAREMRIYARARARGMKSGPTVQNPKMKIQNRFLELI